MLSALSLIFTQVVRFASATGFLSGSYLSFRLLSLSLKHLLRRLFFFFASYPSWVWWARGVQQTALAIVAPMPPVRGVGPG